jgi:hypothetical protein
MSRTGGGESRTSRTGGCKSRSREEQGRSRTGRYKLVRRGEARLRLQTGDGDEEMSRGDEEMAPRSPLMLPPRFRDARARGRAGNLRALNCHAKIGGLALARLRAASAPA